ncbi:MAG: extracellular solute-binding protein [Firmicutes bacterium]|nr:extracellular solute-binding protein [Bacillota bacterium]
MFKRKLMVLISVILVLSMLLALTACSGKKAIGDGDKSSGSTDSSPKGDTSKNDSLKGSPMLPIVKDKLTLRILSPTRADIQLGNDMPVFQELEKRTNIHLEWEILPITNPDEKFNLIMASGDIPDIIGYSNTDLVLKYGMEGNLIPLQDLIKNYAPNIKKALDNPLQGEKLPYKMNVWGEITALDGNVYSIPCLTSSNAIGAVYGIREDWLKKLGLNIPETIDELYNVLKAFKERDPNSNGEQDEIPFIAGQGGKTNTILPIINAFGAHMDLYVDPATDTIKYGPIEESYKEGLAFLNKLYTEGLLEQDYLTATRDQWLSKAGGNKAGFMFVWPGSGFAASNAALQKLNPEFNFTPILPMKSKDGKRYKDSATAGRYVLYRTSISKSNKYPVETIKYLDYLFTEEATILVSYGIEGLHYNMVNGKPVYTDLITKNPEGIDPETARIKDGMFWQALPYQIGWDSHFQAMEKTAPWTIKAWELYRESGIVEAPMPTLMLSEEDHSTRIQISTEIKTYKEPMVDKFIMGVESLNKFDEYVNQIKKSGLDDLLKILNDAYSKYKQAGKN